MVDAAEVLVALYGPPLLLLLSAVSVLQLNLLVSGAPPARSLMSAHLTLLGHSRTAFSHFARTRGSSAVWAALQPGLLQVSKVLDSAFRSGSKPFEPTANHLLLFALILAVLVAGERVRSAARSRV